VEGIRKDVRVMNSSYLGGEWYVDEMKLAANDADGVPFTIPSSKYSFVNDYTLIADVVSVLDNDKARKLREVRRRIESESLYNIRYQDASGVMKSLVGTYAEISAHIKDVQDIIYEYQPIVEEYIAAGDTESDGFYDVYIPYLVARNLFDAIINN
jgi:hypothetical protein